MFNYVIAENLKLRRTFAQKMILLAPLCVLVLAFLSGMYFTADGYNWWYVGILPGFITLLSALVNQYEEKKLGYRAVLSLPVSLAKTWVAKIMLIVFYTIIANFIHLGGMLLGSVTVRSALTVAPYKMLLATLVIIITTLWQIPVCLFLAKKFSLITAILLNVGVGSVLEVIASTKSFWWSIPYSYSARLICPIMGLLPNGVFAEKGDLLLDTKVIPMGIVLSLLLFAALLSVTTYWFTKQEVK